MSHPVPGRTYEEDAEAWRNKFRMERLRKYNEKVRKFTNRLKKDSGEISYLANNKWVDRRAKGRV